MSYGSLVVNSWVGIHEGCEFTCSVNGSDSVYVTADGAAQPFEFFFQAEALRQFIEQGAKALAEMDALAAEEDAAREVQERTAQDPSPEVVRTSPDAPAESG